MAEYKSVACALPTHSSPLPGNVQQAVFYTHRPSTEAKTIHSRVSTLVTQAVIMHVAEDQTGKGLA